MPYYKVPMVLGCQSKPDDGVGSLSCLTDDEADKVRGSSNLNASLLAKVKGAKLTYRPAYLGSLHYCKEQSGVPRQFLIEADAPPYEGAVEVTTDRTLQLYGVPV